MAGHRAWFARCALLIGALLILATANGCGDGSAESSGPTAALRITKEFGHEIVWARDDVPLKGNGTLLRQLRDEHETKMYDGAPVAVVIGIDGLNQRMRPEGDEDPTSWVIQVNGVETDVTADKYRLYPGDVVQWDLRDWFVTLDVRATVGAFPETFTRGVFGKTFPVRVLCEDDTTPACRRVRRVLTRAGLRLGPQRRPRSQLPPPGNPQRARVLVGKWKHWHHRPWPSAIDRGARYSGVFARFSPDAESLRLYDWNDERVREVGAGTGLVAAMRPTEEDLMWYVTGVDDEGVERAARALDPDTLRDAYAVAITDDGAEKLPLVPSR